MSDVSNKILLETPGINYSYYVLFLNKETFD